MVSAVLVTTMLVARWSTCPSTFLSFNLLILTFSDDAGALDGESALLLLFLFLMTLTDFNNNTKQWI